MKPRMHTDARGSEKALPCHEITRQIIGSAYTILNTLGCGFLEKVYENAMAVELKEAGLHVIQQAPLRVWYRDQTVGEYVADLIVEHQVIVELKTVRSLDDIHAAQCLNYLKATRLPVCLLMNFASPTLEFKRFVL